MKNTRSFVLQLVSPGYTRVFRYFDLPKNKDV